MSKPTFPLPGKAPSDAELAALRTRLARLAPRHTAPTGPLADLRRLGYLQLADLAGDLTDTGALVTLEVAEIHARLAAQQVTTRTAQEANATAPF